MPTFGELVTVVKEAVQPDNLSSTVTETIDATTAAARDLANKITDGIGDLVDVTEDALAQLTADQQAAVATLAEATRELRSAADTLRGMVPALEEVVRKPLFEKLATENLAVVTRAAVQCQRVVAALMTVFRAMKTLIAPFPTVIATVRARFASWYDAA